ncbi:MAG: hypothetical protein SFU53_10670 [Terrimicrobiaceae bacterium]|nr:hypothetical protein [Terrimicrobiaceae bacterium]
MNNSSSSAGGRAFLITSFLFLILGTLMLAGRPQFLMAPSLTGHGVAWLELLLLGFAFPAAFGLAYLAIPRAFGLPLYSTQFVFLHLGFHLAGMILVVASPLLTGIPQIQMGPTFLAVGALTFAINIGCSLRGLRVPDAGAAFLVTAMLWLVIASFLGAPFAATAPATVFQGQGWSGGWLVLALGGVILNTIFGLGLRVTPVVLRLKEIHPAPAWYAFVISNFGLAWLFAALALGPMSFAEFCAAFFLLGTLIYLGKFLLLVQQRPDRSLPWDVRILLTTTITAPLAIALAGVAAWQRVPVASQTPAAATPAPETPAGPLPLEILPVDTAAVLTALLAVAVPGLVALAFQLVRIERAQLGGDAESTFQGRLTNQILLAAYFNYATGVLMVIPAAWVGIERILTLGSLFLFVGAAGFAGTFLFATSKSKVAAINEEAAVPKAG